MIKKKRKKLLLLLISIVGIVSIILPKLIHASVSAELVQELISDVYYVRKGGVEGYASLEYYTYTMSGKTVYCIEPGVAIHTSNYNEFDGLVASPYDSEKNKLFELIGHYGYDYPGRNTLKFRMATQALIWEVADGSKVEYYTKQFGAGNYIDIEYEKNIIMESVNKHYNRPSFNGGTQNAIISKEFELEDTNGVLEDYEIYSSNNLSVRFDGNKIFVTPLKAGELSLVLNRKHYDNFTTIVFHGNDNKSQKMGYFRFSDPVIAVLNLNVDSGEIEITKKDIDLNDTKSLGDATLIGAIYDVYNANNEIVDTLTISNEYKAKSIDLPLGTYTIKERTPSRGYTLDTNTYTVTINEDNLKIKLDVFEKIINGDLTLFKVYSTNETGIMTGEPNVTFKFTLISNNEVYKTATTDSNGFLTVNLPYGIYNVSQETATENYEKVKDFIITIDENAKNPLYNILGNAEKTARLKVIKVDEEGNKIVRAGIKFKIKNTDTNTYVEQTITYPEKQTISIFETSADGTLLTPYPLSSGNYQLEEVENQLIYGFAWNKEPISFSIGDNSDFINDDQYGNIIELKFINKAVYGEFMYEKTGEKLVIENNTFTYEKTELKDVLANIYADEDIYYLDKLIYKKGDLVVTIKPLERVKLYLGKYYLEEIKTEEEHVLDSTKKHFEIKQTNQYDEIIKESIKLDNYLKKGKVYFTKIDLNTSKALPNTKIQVFTNKDELIFEGITDSDGNITIENLFVGKFYILESEAPEGYILNTEKLWFEITENGQIIKCEMSNERIIPVPITEITDNHIIEIIGGFIILIGIGVIIYANKKKK